MSATPDPRDGDWHRRQGVEANNTTWELLDRTDRSPDDDEEPLRRAYTAAYHRQRATTAARRTRPGRRTRRRRRCSRPGSRSGPSPSPTAASRSASVPGSPTLTSPTLLEARARALRALGRADEVGARHGRATVPGRSRIPSDRAIVEKDFADW
ncbi:MAG: hypothetical protein R2734_02765 [Nocardioides sp.]